MKALLWAVLAATGLWTGYWWVGASSIESAVQSWFAENASHASQRQAHGHLQNLQALLQQEQLGSPAIIIVGDVLQGLSALKTPQNSATKLA